jgi:hypothetical protein
MPRQHKSSIHTYSDAEKYLGCKLQRPCDFGFKQCKIVRENDTKIQVTLYENVIIVLHKDGTIEYPYHGMYENSQTTKRILRAFLI